MAENPECYEMHYQDEAHLETNPYHLCKVWHRVGEQPELPAAGTNRRVTVFGSTEAFGRGRVEVVCAGQDSACFLLYLRDGIRTARRSKEKGTFVFCQAGSYQKLYLVDEDGKVQTRDFRRILDAVRSTPDDSKFPVPKSHNETVMQVKRIFKDEVRDRRAEIASGSALSPAQDYVKRELTILYGNSLHDEVKKRAVAMDRAFGVSLVEAIQKELKPLISSKMTGEDLLISLESIYSRYGLHDRLRSQGRTSIRETEAPRIVCSEALLT